MLSQFADIDVQDRKTAMEDQNDADAILAGEAASFNRSSTMDGSLVDNDSLEVSEMEIREGSSKNFLSKFFRDSISKKMQDKLKYIDDTPVHDFGDNKTSLSMRRLMKEAHAGDLDSQFSLGYCYDLGKGVEAHTNDAIYWYTIAANRGHAIAQNNLGVLYSTGHNGRMQKDQAEALYWYKKAAKKGNPNAQFHCGLAHMNGEGLEKRDDGMAFQWFKKAAKQGHVLAMSNVGAMYMGGRGIQKNYKKAFKWLMKAIAGGDAVAMHNAGVMYVKGYDILQDERLGNEYIQTAVSTGLVPDDLSAMAVKQGLTLYNS